MPRLAALVIAACAAGLAGVQVDTQEPPAVASANADAANLKLIQAACGGCHTQSSILDTHRTRQDWSDVLERMIDEGAVLTYDEFDRMWRYLSTRSGRVDVNVAPADDIRAVLELTDDEVRRLVSARADGRVFRSLADLAATIELPLEALATRRSRIDFGASRPAPR